MFSPEQHIHVYTDKDDGCLIEVRPSVQPHSDTAMIVLLDCSMSMTAELPAISKSMSDYVLHTAPIGCALIVIAFGSTAEVLLMTESLAPYERDSLTDKIQSLKPMGGTNIQKALDLANTHACQLEQSKSRMLLVTDGQANEGAKTSGVDLAPLCVRPTDVIMFRNGVDHELVKNIKRIDTNNRAHFVNNEEDLVSKLSELLNSLSVPTHERKVTAVGPAGKCTKTIPAMSVAEVGHVYFSKAELAALGESVKTIELMQDNSLIASEDFNSIIGSDKTPRQIEMIKLILKNWDCTRMLNNRMVDAIESEKFAGNTDLPTDNGETEEFEEIQGSFGDMNLDSFAMFRSLRDRHEQIKEIRAAYATETPKMPEFHATNAPTQPLIDHLPKKKIGLEEGGRAAYRSLGACSCPGDDVDVDALTTDDKRAYKGYLNALSDWRDTEKRRFEEYSELMKEYNTNKAKRENARFISIALNRM